MAKSSQSRQFRKVNVDEFDENNFVDDVVEDGQTGPDEGEVTNLLNAKKNTEALKVVLANRPVGGGHQLQAKALQLAVRVLSVYRSNEIEAAVKSLSKDEIDTLMKYIYEGFAEPTDKSCGVLLSWHEKAFAEGGVGSIVRVLTDRKSV